jgi:hypothetical protein
MLAAVFVAPTVLLGCGYAIAENSEVIMKTLKKGWRKMRAKLARRSL